MYTEQVIFFLLFATVELLSDICALTVKRKLRQCDAHRHRHTHTNDGNGNGNDDCDCDDSRVCRHGRGKR